MTFSLILPWKGFSLSVPEVMNDTQATEAGLKAKKGWEGVRGSDVGAGGGEERGHYRAADLKGHQVFLDSRGGISFYQKEGIKEMGKIECRPG